MPGFSRPAWRPGLCLATVLAAVWLSACAKTPEQRAYRERLEAGFTTPDDVQRLRTPEVFHLRLRASARDFVPTDAPAIDRKLMQASTRGDLSGIRDLLARQAHVNAVDASGNSALLFAAREGHTALVRALLDAGARVDGLGGAMPPLAAAAVRGHTAVVQLLLRAGADPDAAGANGHAALMNAVKTNRLAVATVLLAAGADTRVVDRVGDNLLTVCVEADQVAMLALLLQHGVQPDMADSNGLSALYWAEFLKKPVLAGMLREAGADSARRKARVVQSRRYDLGEY